ncbi:MAG: CocE/NonD family hydrolase [candidate division KSB1 bacterium]|nr:CocE/NonD family hydrolase [candidate division KSB1 bacterium]
MKRSAFAAGFMLVLYGGLSGQTPLTIPMRDGTPLAGDLYLPGGGGPWPAVALRTPYGRRSPDVVLFANLLRSSGYAVVVEDTRGRFGSAGTDSVFLDDGWGRNQDGYDTVEWIAAQQWCNGRVGLWGLSALGISAYLAAGAAPPHLACCFVGLASADLYHEVVYPGGVLQKNLVEGWLSARGTPEMIGLMREHPTYDQFWQQANLFERPSVVNVPIFHLAGWYDVFCRGPINAFAVLQAEAGSQAKGRQVLLVAPTTHDFRSGELSYPTNSAVDLVGETRRWFDVWLKGNPYPDDLPPVRIYLMGDTDSPHGPGNQWVRCEAWPPQPSWRTLFLAAPGELTTSSPTDDSAAIAYAFDPTRPVPTRGGQNLPPFLEAGPYDQRPNQESDLLRFTTAPLEEPLEVVGTPTVTLYASSDGPDTDWIVKLVDVYPDGREMLVCDGVLRARYREGFAFGQPLEPGVVYEFCIELLPTAIVFAPGHRVQLQVTSSSYPRLEPNPNTGALPGTDPASRVALNTIMCNEFYPSHLLLPVTNLIGPSVVEETTGRPPEQPRLVRLYPNPARERTTLLLDLHAPADLEIVIFDVRGRAVAGPTRQHIGPEKTAMPLSTQGLPAGLYLVRLRAAGLVATGKLVITH